MEERTAMPSAVAEGVLLAVGLVALTALGWGDPPWRFLLAHTLAELFVIVVAAGTFMIVWNSRRFVQNGYLMVLAVAGVFAAAMDLTHTLTYMGMSVTPIRGPDIPTQLWLAGRYIQAGSILVAPAFIGRRVRVRVLAGVYAALSAVLLASILSWHYFPDAFVEGRGLTAFKVASEYVIVAAFLGGLLLLLRRRDAFEPRVLRLLAAFISLLAVAELPFTSYGTVYSPVNLMGHVLRVMAAYTLYRAIIVTSLASPYDLLFRELKQSEAALRDSEERFRTTFEQARVGIAHIALDGRWLRVNDRLCEIAGRSRRQMESLTSQQLTYPEDLEHEKPLIDALVDGTSSVYTLEKRYVLPDGSLRWVSATRSLLRAEDGAPRYFIAVVEDIQARRDAEERLRRAKELSEALNEIDAAMNSSHESESIMRVVVDRGAEALGVEALRLTLREGDRWVERYVMGLADGAVGGLLTDEAAPLDVFVERTQQPLVVQDVAGDGRVPAGDRIRRSGAGSYLGVPLMSRDEVIGVLGFAKIGTPVAFSAEQVDFASRLAASLSLALENARLYEVEHSIADTLQEALLSPPPRMPGLEFAHLYRSATETARVGGDFYDVFEVAPGVVGIIVGDVSGKGIEAAALTAVAKTAVKANATAGGLPAEVMTRVNDFLRRHTSESAFVTVFFGTIDLATGEVSYCSGGHPPAVLRRADGTTVLLKATSPLVGAFEDVAYCDEAERIEVGDLLLLYTDGVIECRGPDGQFGEERLLEVASRWQGDAAGLPAHVLEAVVDHCGGVLADDIAVVALSRV